jgi:Uma2 family endonuclease
MGVPQTQQGLDAEAYLAWEATQADRHEYVAGEVFAMVGARLSHNTVALNIAFALRSKLKGSPCRVYALEAKLRVETSDAFFYPDVVVSCDARDRAGEDRFLSHPVLVVEVLSESTAAYDRGQKFACYRQLADLQEVVIVDIDARRVECFRRDEGGHWVLHEFDGSATAEFASVGLMLPLAEVFEDVNPS